MINLSREANNPLRNWFCPLLWEMRRKKKPKVKSHQIHQHVQEFWDSLIFLQEYYLQVMIIVPFKKEKPQVVWKKMLHKVLLVLHYSKKIMKINALLVSLWVIFRPLIRIWVHLVVERHILDQIQKRKTNQSYSHLRSHIRKKKTRPHHLGVNQKIWWRSRPPNYLYKKMGR